MTEEAEEARGGAAVQAGFPNPKGQCGAFPQGAWGEGVVNRPGLGHSLAGAGSAQPGRYLVGEKPAVPAEAPLLPPPLALRVHGPCLVSTPGGLGETAYLAQGHTGGTVTEPASEWPRALLSASHTLLPSAGHVETLRGPGSPTRHFAFPVRAFASWAGTLSGKAGASWPPCQKCST